MRADIHDGPEQTLQSKAGYIDARPLTASSAKPLATHGRTIHLVESRMGAVAWGLWPTPRFPSPLIKPGVPISCTRLSDWLHRKSHADKLTARAFGTGRHSPSPPH